MAVSVGPGLPALSQTQATLPPTPVAASAATTVATSLYADLGLGSSVTERAGLRPPRNTQEAALLLAMAEIALDQTMDSSTADRRQGTLASLRASILALGSLEQQITRSAEDLKSRNAELKTAEGQLATSTSTGRTLGGQISALDVQAAHYDEIAKSFTSTIDTLKAQIADLGDTDPDKTKVLQQSLAANLDSVSQAEDMRDAGRKQAEILRMVKAANDSTVAQQTATVSRLTGEVTTLTGTLNDMRALSRQLTGALIAALAQALTQVQTGTGAERHEEVRSAVLDLGFDELDRIATAHDATSLAQAEADTKAMRERAEEAALRRAERRGAGLAAGVADALASLAAMIVEEAEASREAIRPTERVRLVL